MNIDLTNGVALDLTTAISAVDTDDISVESNFDTDKSVYLALAVTAPLKPEDYDAVLIPINDSPLCWRSVTGKAGLKLWALVASNPDSEDVTIRVNKG